MKSILILAIGMLLTCTLTIQGDQDPMGNPYTQEWTEIDDLDRKGLPKSALQKVEELLSKLKPNEEDQRIKCIIYRNKYLIQLEEYGPEKAIGRIEDEVLTAEGVTLAVLHSMLGELYYGYGERNRHKLSKRSAVQETDNPDLAAWSLAQIISRSNLHYNASIEVDLSDKDLSSLHAILNKFSPSTIDFIPDVSTFLRYRALEHFSKSTSMLTEPVYAFLLDQVEAFADRSAFLQASFESRDTQSYLLKTIKLYQEILGSAEHKPLHYFDNARLQFVHQHSTHSGKDSLFEKSLIRLIDQKNPYAVVSLSKYYVDQGRRYQEQFDRQYNWQISKAHEILIEHPFDKRDSFLGDERLRLLQQITQKSLSFQLEEVVCPDRPFLAYVRYQNVTQLRCKILRVDRKIIVDLHNMDQDKKLKRILELPTHKEWNVQVEGEDYNLHATEIKCERLPLGQYILVISDGQSADASDLVQYSSFQVSNLSSHVIGGGDPNLVTVTDRWSGQPVADVNITYFNSRYDHRTSKHTQDKMAAGTTNQDGIHELSINDGNRNMGFHCVKGDDYFYPNYRISNHRYANNKTSQEIHIFTDRNLYRPGQIVHFKALVLDINAQGIPSVSKHQSITLTLKDANYQDAQQLKLKTNDYGSVSGHFTAPQGGLNGLMHILATVNKGRGRQNIRVEEYKRPTFAVNIDEPSSAYALYDTVSIAGSAKMFSSAPVDGAKVKYTVTRRSRYYGWYYRGPGMPSMQIATGATKTKADGSFNIRFPLIPDNKMARQGKPVFSFEVQVEVSDVTGETHAKSYTLRAGYEPLLVEIASKDVLDKSAPDSLVVKTQNYSGGEELTSGKLYFYALAEPDQPFVKKYWGKLDKFVIDKESYKSDFSFYTYDDRDEMENWTLVDSMSIDIDSYNGIAIPDLSVGSYKLVATLDYQGAPLTQHKFVQVIDRGRNLMGQAIEVIDPTLESSYEPGDVLTWQPLARDGQHRYFYAIEKGGQIIDRGWKNATSPLSIPVTEADRGGFFVHTFYNKLSRNYAKKTQINVPWTNKELKISYARWKDKLTPGEEVEWTVNIAGDKRDKVEAEYLTAMYDASLDAISRKHIWKKIFYPSSYSRLRIMPIGYNAVYSISLRSPVQINTSSKSMILPQLNWYQLNEYIGHYPSYERGQIMLRGRPMMARKSATADMAGAPPRTNEPMVAQESVEYAAMSNDSDHNRTVEDQETHSSNPIDIPLRENLDETVFFFPNIQSDMDGNLSVKFKMNEALTTWKVLSFAHTQDLAYGFAEEVLQTSKDVMVYPNMPRFLRIGDDMVLNAKVINSSDNEVQGDAILHLKSLPQGEVINSIFDVEGLDTNFVLGPGESKEISWSIHVPKSYLGLIEYEVSVSSGVYTDGERGILPVLTNRKLVTETMPIFVRGGESKTFHFEGMSKMDNGTIENQNFALEFTSHPMWYAVQALPFMAEKSNRTTEQILNRYYANVLAAHIANAIPNIRSVFEQWSANDPDALTSALEKNQELKSAILKETPWVRDAQSESEQKRNIALLFDENFMKYSLGSSLQKLVKSQTSNGGFPWIKGGKDDWYITQYVLEGLGHLMKFGALDKAQMGELNYSIELAQNYLNRRVIEYYEKSKNEKTVSTFNSLIIHYLYTKSLFSEWQSHKDNESIESVYIQKLKEEWLSYPLYEQGMCALILHRRGDAQALDMLASFKERALSTPELGMYWKTQNGYRWNQLPIERHALMIEVFTEIEGHSNEVDELKLWLLKQKQTSHWPTTKSTSAAIYALLIGDPEVPQDEWVLETEPVDVKLGGSSITFDAAQAGTGYLKVNKDKGEINKELATIEVVNPNQNVAWGAAYYQYLEDLDKIDRDDSTPLKLKKDIFKVVTTDTGEELVSVTKSQLNPGDQVKVRIEVQVDRAMEYVHMKDMRSSGLEPIGAESRYKWNHGLGYYESPEDLATNFFFSYLPKGTHVFEYPLRAVHRGTFTNGVTTIQSMYAPEFNSHSKGETLVIK